MSAFDEQPDGDQHGECAAEIRRLDGVITDLAAALKQTTFLLHSSVLIIDDPESRRIALEQVAANNALLARVTGAA